MTKEELFSIWSPAGGLWSPWVKPVLFAHFDEQQCASIPTTPVSESLALAGWRPADAQWISQDGRTALVVDLPGEQSVEVGLALAGSGYRPVPLFNACPPPWGWLPPPVPPLSPQLIIPEQRRHAAVVDVWPILVALWRGAELIRDVPLPNDAPPAFLLDANRRGSGPRFGGDYDNRSVSFPTDFPSANFLLAQGIGQAVLIQRGEPQPQADLAHTLRRWQDAGIQVLLKLLDVEGPPASCVIERPSRFGAAWYRFLESLGFRRHVLGGFGGLVPEAGSG